MYFLTNSNIMHPNFPVRTFNIAPIFDTKWFVICRTVRVMLL